MPKVVILIVNWNGWKDTVECLASIFRTGGPDWEAVVIDNDSQDGSVGKIMKWASEHPLAADPAQPVRRNIVVARYDRETGERGGTGGGAHLVIIETEKNLGFAGGNNVGIRYALARGADYVLLLNNDAALLNRESLASLVAFMEGTPKAGACGGRLFYPNGDPQQSYGNFPSLARTLGYLFPLQRVIPASFRKRFRSNVVPDPSVTDPFPVDYPSGAFFLARVGTIREIGMLDERYFMYVEETDWCYRMMQHGWGRYCVPRAEAMHKVAGSFRSAPSRMHAYFIDSLFRYYEKHFPRRSRRAVFAAFWTRSFLAAAGWKAALRVLPKGMHGTALERVEHWTGVRALSAAAIDRLRAGTSNRREALAKP